MSPQWQSKLPNLHRWMLLDLVGEKGEFKYLFYLSEDTKWRIRERLRDIEFQVKKYIKYNEQIKFDQAWKKLKDSPHATIMYAVKDIKKLLGDSIKKAKTFKYLTERKEEELLHEIFNEEDRFYYHFYLDEKTQDLIRGLMSAYIEYRGGVKTERFARTIKEILEEAKER